ncbi:MAG: PAS domain-containing protein [Spirochaetales bacterium]|nr:PAS domain-containing protein [Spirochaetales bacterium]
MRLLPFALEGILIFIGFFILEGIPPQGLVTMTIGAVLASVLINNRYISGEMEEYLKKEIVSRTRELRESERRYRTLVNNIPGVAYRCRDDEYMTMLFISDEIERLTGYKSSDFIENRIRSFRSIIHPDNPASTGKAMRDALKNDVPFRIEYRILDRKGQTRWFLEKGAGVKDDKGSVAWIDGVIIDITEEKLLALEKEKWEEQYRQAQRLESIGRLAGGIAHDLNNLLTPVLGYAELTSPLVEDNSEAKGYIGEIIKAAKRARDLILQLLTLSRGQKLAMEEIDMNSLTENFSGLLRKAVRDDIIIDYRKAPELPLLWGSRSQLEQIILNLAVNAQDAMPDGGEIVITTARDGERVILTVSDTGDGIDRETEEHMFEPFFTTKGPGGTGLGLATVYGIMQQHNGNIHVEPNGERGALFRMEFPSI